MKTKYLTLVLVITAALNGFAQNKLQTCTTKENLTLDFIELQGNLDEIKLIKTDCKLQTGVQYYLKINNINMNVFNVSSTITYEKFNEEKPEVFSSFKLPGFLNLSLPKPSEDISGLDYGSVTSDFEQLKELFKNVNDQINSLNRINQMLDFHKLNCSNSLNDILGKINSDFIKFRMHSNSTSIEDYILIDVIGKINEALNKTSEFEDVYEEYKTDKFNTADQEIKLIQKEIVSLTKKLKLLEKQKKSTLEIKIKIAGENEKIEILNGYKKKIKDYKTRVNSFIKSLKDEKLFSTLYTIVNKRKSFQNANFSYIFPFRPKKDLTKIELTISTDKLIPCNFPKKMVLNEELWNYDGLKVDFSTGAMVSFGNDNFIGNEYEYYSTGETTSAIRAKDGGTRGLLSVGGFAHFYKRTNKKTKVAFSPGLSINDDFDGLLYHLGISLIFGKKSRGILTTGFSFKSSEILDKNYDEGVNYETESLPELPSTISVFPQAGWFLSLSYNLSKND